MRLGNGLTVEGVSEACGALTAVIDAKQARGPPTERGERRGRPCPHHTRRAERSEARERSH